MKLNSILALLLVSIWSCNRKVYVPTNTSSPQRLTEYSESLERFIPKYSYEENSTIISNPKLRPSVKITADPQNDNQKVLLKLKEISQENSLVTTKGGYRLLIYSGNEREEFQQAKTFILANYPNLEIYESYKQPTYKIKVGDFNSKLEAQRYHGMLEPRFTTATIIFDKINIKNSLNN